MIAQDLTVVPAILAQAETLHKDGECVKAGNN